MGAGVLQPAGRMQGCRPLLCCMYGALANGDTQLPAFTPLPRLPRPQERLEAFIEAVSIPPALIHGIVQARCTRGAGPAEAPLDSCHAAAGVATLLPVLPCCGRHAARRWQQGPAAEAASLTHAPPLAGRRPAFAGRDGGRLPGAPAGAGRQAGLHRRRRHRAPVGRLPVRRGAGLAAPWAPVLWALPPRACLLLGVKCGCGRSHRQAPSSHFDGPAPCDTARRPRLTPHAAF